MSQPNRATIAALLVAAALAYGVQRPASAQTSPGEAKTLGQASCAQHCHVSQNRWWFRDPHYRSADPLVRGDPDYLRVASNYGTNPDLALLPSGPCARCHATAISVRGELPFRDGVSCESCHGAAERWIQPHSAGEKGAGRNRVGFVQALAAGLTDLETLEVLAATCTRCHYITDRKLVAAGHTSGRSFDYAKGLESVRHWEPRPDTPEAIAVAFQNRFAELGSLPPESVGLISAPKNATQPGTMFRLRRERSAPVARPSAEPRCPPLDLPPFPTVDGSVAMEERLRILAERLQRLFRESKKSC